MANNIRTQEEYKKPEYNYFIALKLGIKEKNTANIEKSISKTCGSTKGDLISRRLIELRQDMTEIMVNDATYNPQTGTYTPNSGGRQREADAAKELKLEELMKLVYNMCMSNGRIFKSTLNELCIAANKTAEYFTLDELIKKCDSLKAQGVKFIDNMTSAIPFSEFQTAGQLLETPPAKADLYEFLGVSKDASVAEISAARANAYNEAQKKSDLKIKQSVSALCAKVDGILTKSPEIRKQYDYYIKVKDTVWDQFKMRKTYGAKSISLDEYYQFAEELQRSLSIKIDEVEEMLGAGLKFYGLVVAGDEGDGSAKEKLGIPDLELCPYADCGQIYKAGAKACPHCGRPLEILCWNCGNQVPFTTKHKTCSHCGASHDGKDRYETVAREIDTLLRASVCDIPKLQAALMTLKNLVPNDKGDGKSTISKKVMACEKTIADKIKEEETTGEKYRADEKAVQEQIALKNLMTAASMVSNMRRTYPTYNTANTQALANSIQATVSKAQAGLELVKRYAAQGNEPMVIDSASKVLEICADYLEAKQFLQKFPPKTPAAPVISVSDDGKVHLEWRKEGDQKLVTYTVIKKIGTAPQNVKDGSLVEENLEINFYEDSNIVSATPYHYAVFATRCGVTSGLLVFPSAVQVFGDVSGIQQEILPGKISVHWEAPQNYASIDVWKKEGTVAPLKAGDGTKLSGTKDGFVDEDCQGESSYLIICTYKTAEGVKCSRGITRTFKKYDLIEPLRDVKLTQNTQTEFCLSCKNPSDEKIRLVFSKTKLPCRADTVLQMMDYNSYLKGGTTLPVFYDNDGATCFNLPANAIGYVYVLVYNDQLFCASAPIAANTVAGITSLAYEEQTAGVKIRGNLNPATKRVIAKISDTAFAKSIDEKGEQIAITREQFERDGGFTLKLKTNASHYISVFAELDLEGHLTTSYGTPLDSVIDLREKVSVQYCMEYTATPAKPFKMTLKFAADQPVEVPDMVLMKGVPRPLTKSAGTLVERISGVTLKKGMFSKNYTAKITVTVPADRANMKFILFLADDHVKHAKLKEVTSL